LGVERRTQNNGRVELATEIELAALAYRTYDTYDANAVSGAARSQRSGNGTIRRSYVVGK
jgi:hypothetical protein